MIKKIKIDDTIHLLGREEEIISKMNEIIDELNSKPQVSQKAKSDNS